MHRSIWIDEVVLEFDPALLRAWTNGDKSLAPPFMAAADNRRNQPSYHFGEAFVLRHFHEREGWLGFTDYAIGPQYPGSLRRQAGREELARRVPAPALTALRALRSGKAEYRLGSGEPDVFLYHPDGRLMFLEVKKGKDRVDARQTKCLGQIAATIGCPVGIVYLKELGRRRTPRRYELPLPEEKELARARAM